MIVDLTKEFHRLAKTTHQGGSWSNVYDKSQFLEYSTKVLHEVLNIESRLQKLSLLILKHGTLNKEQGIINKQFINIKESLKEVDKKVRNCLTMNSDLKTSKEIKQKFKEQVSFILQCKLLSCSLKYKEQYEIKIDKQSSLLTKTHDLEDEDARFSKSTFLDESKAQILERQTAQQYQEIEKGMAEVTETYKSMLEMVRMHELVVGTIAENTEIAYDNILEGRKNLSEVNENEKSNRRFIVKVFLVLYVFVFIYINILL